MKDVTERKKQVNHFRVLSLGHIALIAVVKNLFPSQIVQLAFLHGTVDARLFTDA